MPTRDATTVEQVRTAFPSLQSGFAFMDNAGGSQLPGVVADAIYEYLSANYVQLGAGYAASQRATAIVDEAHDFISTLMGADGAGKIILGSSTSALLRMVADRYAETLKAGDEIVVAESGHEANVSPWVSLASRGATVKLWEADEETGVCSAETLAGLLSERTRIVAFPQVSNLLGAVEDVALCVKLAHRAGARVVVDGVAYAPHAAMRVGEWGVDWYAFSCYKVFGPHMAALYGSSSALQDVVGYNHPFFRDDDIPTKFELGGVNHEGCAGLLAIRPYLKFVAGGATDKPFDRSTVVAAFEAVEALERPLVARFLDFLNSKLNVRVVGPTKATPARLATISFVHRQVASDEISSHLDDNGIGMRSGHMYSVRLLERMGIPPLPGVARVSLVHYNTLEEVDRLIGLLDPIL